MAKNLFCERADLDSEADVESLFVDRLLKKLRYPDNRVKRKDTLDKISIARGRKKENFRPDYVLLDRSGDPVLIIDAKTPKENPSDYQYQVCGYAFGINQTYQNYKPVKYAVVTNGLQLLLYPWDSDTPRLSLSFDDFLEDNLSFIELRSLLTYGSLDIVRATSEVFEFARPNLNELIRVFDECHQMIWKKEKKPPTEAFYEFAKLMFVKLREDQRIAKLVESGRSPNLSDFNFSVSWIEEQVDKGIDENPIANILFRRIRDDLEVLIKSGHKKRIFLKDEPLNLSLTTILEVVRRLENLDLHGIDEDLNGRMFETFLNATVRGKALGQFFTPRSVVKYMTGSAGLKAKSDFLPTILDGCCGSGGFLIEAMAVLAHQIDVLGSLSSRDRSRLKKQLYSEHLYGIDANETIARIARLNMYLHGDGGSKIFSADGLDKTIQIDKGLPDERRDEVGELHKRFVIERQKFNFILTNPPFSMSYKSNDPNEARVLSQYDITQGESGSHANTAKSNVLFIERYAELLADRGELLTVIDNTVLNGFESQRFRDFIFDKFIIKQVVSLPINTFYRAQAKVQTSILHLRKKEAGEEQGAIFMAILNNIGHDDLQRYTPGRDNTPKLSEVYQSWVSTGVATQCFEDNTEKDEQLGCPFQTFVVTPDTLERTRLDAFYYAPDLKRTELSIRSRVAKGKIRLLNPSSLNIVRAMTNDEAGAATGQLFKYFEISDCTRSGSIVNHRYEPFEELPSRARLQVKTNDVLFAKNRNSRGTSVIVPEEFNNQLVTTGFIAIRPDTIEDALLLWSIFVSETFRKQVYYLSVTAVQAEMREEVFKSLALLPVPANERDRKSLVTQAREVRKLHEKVRKAVNDTSNLAVSLFEG